MKNFDKQAVKRTISLPRELLQSALARSAEQERNLSNYVRSLIVKDLKGQLGIEPPSSEAPQAKEHSEAA